MKWDRIRGHENIIRSFDAAWRKGRLGHSFLFIGPAGVGKQTAGRELARALLCEELDKELCACGQCASCKLVDAGTHPDLILATRPEESLVISIESMRETIEHLSLKPARGGRKVLILDDADDMSDQAANAFLKTLEEPPTHSILILIGGRSIDQQLPTIVSRCQVVSFGPISSKHVLSYLREHGVTDAAQLERLVRMGGGSIGQALALNDPALWAFRQTLLAAVSKDPVEAFALATQWNQFDEDAGKEGGVRRRRASLVLTLLLGLFQDALRILHGNPPLVAGPEDVELLRKLGSRLGADQLLSWMDRAMEADIQISRMVQLDLVVEAYADSLAR